MISWSGGMRDSIYARGTQTHRWRAMTPRLARNRLNLFPTAETRSSDSLCTLPNLYWVVPTRHYKRICGFRTSNVVEIPLDPGMEGIVGSEKKKFLARVNNGEKHTKINTKLE